MSEIFDYDAVGTAAASAQHNPQVVPSLVATLATGEAMDDLRTLLFSLTLFNEKVPKVYLYCDRVVAAAIPSFKYPAPIIFREALEPYAKKSRAEMEQLPGKEFKTLWFDFMAEKISLLSWTFESEPTLAPKGGVLFCDADICFLGPLPSVPARGLVGLSRHEIRPTDESRYGRWNGGFLWMGDRAIAPIWKDACHSSRFYEQAALETVANLVRNSDPDGFYEFPRTQNYGWWRLWQGEKHPEDLQREWTMNRMKAPGTAGILINGEPLGSIHTHFFGPRLDAPTRAFNEWVIGWLKRLSSGHAPARRLLGFLSQRAS